MPCRGAIICAARFSVPFAGPIHLEKGRLAPREREVFVRISLPCSLRFFEALLCIEYNKVPVSDYEVTQLPNRRKSNVIQNQDVAYIDPSMKPS
jgi:hypothetical protein